LHKDSQIQRFIHQKRKQERFRPETLQVRVISGKNCMQTMEWITNNHRISFSSFVRCIKPNKKYCKSRCP